ncbi:hypothetical protein TAO_1066 [Candidatus Nitrosoglobus terrae]|uniref:Uncharacterized protein n=1 Tax=Candidatus Nitrosoglobus terrae TaxID=1630141 RepID=A0A1Q2SMS5_9GAMM|nr:hypothetical protein [Candidatus Nitrosoglobus terrae]BAW80436.1 hypothetical protein TAO_1066 [Candidatus Nitrosoglobus terrae]
MIALQEINPSIRFEIYTQTPLWFFQSSLVNNFNYHPLLTDIGLIQTSPLHIDLKQTIVHLNNFFPKNMVLLPYHSNFYHPDLIGSSDLVLGKLGYSTLAETYWAKIPFGYITRSNFRESDILATFVTQEMSDFAMSESDFIAGKWISMLPSYLGLSSPKRNEPNGFEQIANFITSL